MSKAKRVMLFIPAYNAERTICSVLDRISPGIYRRVSEIFVHDDCSRDSTVKRALEYKRKHRWAKLTVVRSKRNLGYGGSKKKAYSYAIKKGYDIVIMVHGDGQYPPEKFWEMIKPLEDGSADMAIGARMGKLEGGMPLWRFVGNRILGFAGNMMLNAHLNEFTSGYRAYTTGSLRRLPFVHNSDDFQFGCEILIQYTLAGFRIAEVPIETCYGEDVSSISRKAAFMDGCSFLRNLISCKLAILGLTQNKKFSIEALV